ncbi:MAG: hypothetical protein JRJ15_12975 [Deltaproteobacteria bacterium]|nr:hypothetical protein [Deltaproteobacteria bacterium]
MVSQNFNQLTYLDNIQSLTDVDVPKTYPSVQTAQSDKFYMLFASKPNPITNTGNQRLDLGFLELHQWKKGQVNNTAMPVTVNCCGCEIFALKEV